MTADTTQEAVPSLFFRTGAHRDAPTSDSGAVGEWGLECEPEADLSESPVELAADPEGA
jgi:hypothetical protein